jgi:hypothetical protein
MGFLKVAPVESHPPCPVPWVTRSWRTAEPDFGVGTLWQCDDCGRTWKLVFIPARGNRGKWEQVES